MAGIVIGTALSEPVEITLTDNDQLPWIDILGPVAIVIAAIIAALYARHRMHTEIEAADRRLEKQLKHDREAAAELQEDQLRHDRTLREREAARTTLDQVVALVTETLEAVTQLFALNKAHHELGRELDAIDPANPEGVDLDSLASRTQSNSQERSVALNTAGRFMRDALSALLRLRLRFADDNPIVLAFDNWHRSTKRWYDLIADFGSADEMRQTDLDTIRDAAAVTAEKLSEFRRAVRAWNEA